MFRADFGPAYNFFRNDGHFFNHRIDYIVNKTDKLN